jgi:predicted amidophosphoribosyltransferase
MTKPMKCYLCGRAAYFAPLHPGCCGNRLRLWRNMKPVCHSCGMSNPDDLCHCCHLTVDRMRVFKRAALNPSEGRGREPKRGAK